MGEGEVTRHDNSGYQAPTSAISGPPAPPAVFKTETDPADTTAAGSSPASIGPRQREPRRVTEPPASAGPTGEGDGEGSEQP